MIPPTPHLEAPIAPFEATPQNGTDRQSIEINHHAQHHSDIRSPSPKKPNGQSNFLGLGLPSAATSLPVVVEYPHLAHYVFSLLSTSQTSPPSGAPAHPLSVSSSGESDGSGSDEEATQGQESRWAEQQTPKKSRKQDGEVNGSTGVDKEGLVRSIVECLDNEEEEQVKDLLRPFMGDLAKDEILMDQVCLDCMHRRKDDVEHVPYTPHFTPSRAARASPALGAPNRPFTPTRLPSFRARTPIARPQSPSVSGAHTPTAPYPSSGLVRSESGRSPTVQSVGLPSSSGYSSSGSPVASPRLLSAKATTFNPTAAAFSPSSRAVSAPQPSSPSIFSPSDPWKDTSGDPPRSASPFGAVGPATMVRTSSNLAIAQPLFSDQSSPFHSPIGTPQRGTIKMPDVFASPAFSRTNSRGVVPDDDDDDDFNPFGTGLPKIHHQGTAGLNTGASAFEPFDAQWNSSTLSQSESGQSYDSIGSGSSFPHDAPEDDAGAGMTPLDVLASVFSTVPKADLEDALHRAAYDFEGAMAILVTSHTHPRSGSTTPQRVSSPRPLLGVGSRGAVSLAHTGPKDGYFQQGGRSWSGNLSPGLGGTRSPGGGLRMCRYFLAGECRRSDCRFSHDLDRALCRFWLRGHCAKGPNCEFLHQLPNGMDPSMLSSAMSNMDLGYDNASPRSPGVYGQQHDEFPDLLNARLGRVGAGGRFDPSRNRFANAVKRVAPIPTGPLHQVTGSRLHATQTPFAPAGEQSRTTPLAVPRPSARLKLRPPTLLPTVRTGLAANNQYMKARETSIRLGHARNACLARAADAFRRGDGAAAKRFSREGKTLNEKMLSEAADAAQTLVRDRRKEVQQAVRERDPGWSDDPNDRTERGKECAGGFGVMMGVASKRNIVGGDLLTPSERTECMVDLHTLHGTEGSDILGTFLAELEREHYRGLAYILVGEEKHVGMQDPSRGASKIRLGATIKQSLAEWGYPWNETAGIICVDPCRL